MMRYYCVIECPCDCDTPEEAARIMLATLADPEFEPVVEVLDVNRESCGNYDYGDLHEEDHSVE